MNLTMDDEDDTYGFSSFSDLFDDSNSSSRGTSGSGHTNSSDAHTAPAASTSALQTADAAKPLDIRAMSRLWVSERALAAFELQCRRNQMREYQHIAAKFDGVTIEGGLGSVFYVQSFGGEDGRSGLLWIQAHQSDSNVQEKRKKELQDITNQRTSSGLYGGGDSAKSSSSVFIRITDVAETASKRMQNTVRGIALKLQSGNQFELAFMPGPFANASDHDELLAIVQQSMRASSTNSIIKPTVTKQATPRTPTRKSNMNGIVSSENNTQGRAGAAVSISQDSTVLSGNGSARSSPRAAGAKTQRGSVVSRYVAATRTSPVSKTTISHGSEGNKKMEGDPQVTKEALRAMVRKYLSLDQRSDEAIRLSRKVQALSGYHVGPMSKKFPKFSADPAYRKKTVSELSQFLERMNQEWKQAEESRERSTKVKAARGQNDLFEYTDTDTGEQIPAQVYEERYLKHIEVHKVDPIIRLLPVNTPVPAGGIAAAHEDGLIAGVSTFSSAKKKKEGGTTGVTNVSAPNLPENDDFQIVNSLNSLLGVDITRSCIIDEDFYKQSRISFDDSESRLSVDNGLKRMHLSEKTVAALQDAREELWESWEAALSIYYQRRQTVLLEAEKGKSRATNAMFTSTKAQSQAAEAHQERAEKSRDEMSAGDGLFPRNCFVVLGWLTLILVRVKLEMRKRARDRRRSIAQPSALSSTLSEVHETRACRASGENTETTATSDESTTPSTRLKRRRSGSGTSSGLETEYTATSQAARRKSRRQSIVGVVQLDLDEDTEEKTAAGDTPMAARKSPRTRQSTSPDNKDEANNSAGSKRSAVSLCELCYNENALVHMNPCNHSVCGTCWTRLATAAESQDTNVARMCPWDRELVTKQ